MRTRTPFLHADLDAFYASVEQMLDPSLRGRPVLVGQGIVLAASYEARAFGIHAPMGVRQALARCPTAVVVRGSFDRYSALSRQVMEVCRSASPLVEQLSIDEAFIDVRGSVHLLGDPARIGRMIRERVRHEVGLPLSVGAASTKFLAKVASARAKPDGLLVVDPDWELEWLHALPIEAIWGVGPVTGGRLRERGIVWVADLARTPLATLIQWLGPASARHLHHLAWNRDPRPVQIGRRAGSMGSQSALGRGLTSAAELGRVVLGLADRVSGRLRKKGFTGRTVTMRVRFDDMRTTTRAMTLPAPISSTAALHQAGSSLLAGVLEENPDRVVTLVGISVGRLEHSRPIELELPFERGEAIRVGSPLGAAHLMIDQQVDRIRERFGKAAVGRASLLLETPGWGVPEAFRELAQRD